MMSIYCFIVWYICEVHLVLSVTINSIIREVHIHFLLVLAGVHNVLVVALSKGEDCESPTR